MARAQSRGKPVTCDLCRVFRSTASRNFRLPIGRPLVSAPRSRSIIPASGRFGQEVCEIRIALPNRRERGDAFITAAELRAIARSRSVRARNDRSTCAALRFRHKHDLHARLRQIDPTGKSVIGSFIALSSPLAKNISLNLSGKSLI